MATTSEITTLSSSNPIITINSIENVTSSSSTTSLSNNSTKTASDQIQNRIGKAPLIGALLDCIKGKGRGVSQPQPPTNGSTTISEGDALRNLIKGELSFIKNASEILKKHKEHIKEASDTFENLKSTDNTDDLRKLKKSVMILKQQISSKSKDESESTANKNRNSWMKELENVGQAGAHKSFDEMPQLYQNPTFENSLAFGDFQLLYNSLSRELKLCLLCFSVFPEKVTIKKRVMIYWWIGEGFVPPIPVDPNEGGEGVANQETAEELANGFFDKLLAMGFIEPVYEKRSLTVDSCKMHPFVRSAIIILAERANFFDFDEDGQPKAEFIRSLRACLVGEGLTKFDTLEKLHMVFNINEMILELKPEWFSKMKNVNVLYLGRWQTSATHHIEVEGTDFLDGLESMTHLRFLSFQGISRITELPDSILNLTNMTILDLRACHNLDVIPEGIGLLKSLTHLDMSECYLLDHMPKSLKSLHQLQVLKGFVVGNSKGKNSCTLDDLAHLIKLRKLSIYTGLEQFPREAELKALNIMGKLQKLTIAWGRGSTTPDAQKAETATMTAKKPHFRKGLTRSSAFNQDTAAPCGIPELPLQLQKLDLRCFPRTSAPNWLKPGLLRDLNKLYIRGGKLCDLGQLRELGDEGPEKHKWQVKVLRLKYLTELEMNWRELCELFPELIYVEKVKCPKLTFFPCDETGVWMGKIRENESNF